MTDAQRAAGESRILTPYRKAAGRALVVAWVLGIGGNISAWMSGWTLLLSLRRQGQEFTLATFVESRLWLYWIGFVLWLVLLVVSYRLRNTRLALLRDEFEILDTRARRRTIAYGAVTGISHGSRPIDACEEVPRVGSLRIAYHDSAGNPQSVWLPLLRIADPADIGMLTHSIFEARRHGPEGSAA